MATTVTVKNILVGEGELRLGYNTSQTPVDVGATQEGAELSWEPDMVDIEVDQFGDAAKVVQSRVKCMLKTNLAEATLANLAYAWGYKTGITGNEAIIASQPGVSGQTFNLGIHSAYPDERKLVLIGPAPAVDPASSPKTRTYTCNRVVSYNSSSHSLKRAENVAFPVEFRILPDPTQTGKEYGTIVDQA